MAVFYGHRSVHSESPVQNTDIQTEVSYSRFITIIVTSLSSLPSNTRGILVWSMFKDKLFEQFGPPLSSVVL